MWPAADLAQKLSGAIEFEEARAAVDVGARRANGGVRAAAAVVDPQVARGGGGHAGHFTEMDVGRQLQKITGGIERDFFLLAAAGRSSEPPNSSAACEARGCET